MVICIYKIQKDFLVVGEHLKEYLSLWRYPNSENVSHNIGFVWTLMVHRGEVMLTTVLTRTIIMFRNHSDLEKRKRNQNQNQIKIKIYKIY